MKHITTDELKRMSVTEGLVLQGCSGNPDEWVSGINKILTEAGVLLDGAAFSDIYFFEHDGLTNMLFNMDERKLDHDKPGVDGGTNSLSISVRVANSTQCDSMGNRLSQILNLPVTRETFAEALKSIGIDSLSRREYFFYSVESSDPVLDQYLFHLEWDFTELNYLAAKLQSLDGNGFEMIKAAVDDRRHCGSLKDIINLTFPENLNRFDLIPAFSEEQYGDFLITFGMDEHADAFNRLEESEDPEDRALAAHIERLEAHTDKKAFGRTTAREEGGSFTSAGYLTEGNGFEEIYHGLEDVPVKYRVLSAPQEMLFKVENADLSGLLLKIHALGGDYMADAQYNLNVLADRRSSEYLLLVNGRGIFLTEAAHAYRRGSTAFDVWINTSENPDIKAFTIHVTDMHDPRGLIGDLVEIDVAEHQLDLLRNSIHHTSVDAIMKDGSEKSFTPEEWDEMQQIERDRLQSWNRHFDPNDLQAVIRHLDEIRGEHENIGKTVEPETLLSDLNRIYMEKAENPQPDMLRVTLPAAKEMLARGDADVYRLLPGGPEKLNPLDAVKGAGGLWYQNHREFAVKKDNLAGFDQWAQCETEVLTRRQPERESPDQAKSHEPGL